MRLILRFVLAPSVGILYLMAPINTCAQVKLENKPSNGERCLNEERLVVDMMVGEETIGVRAINTYTESTLQRFTSDKNNSKKLNFTINSNVWDMSLPTGAKQTSVVLHLDSSGKGIILSDRKQDYLGDTWQYLRGLSYSIILDKSLHIDHIEESHNGNNQPHRRLPPEGEAKLIELIGPKAIERKYSYCWGALPGMPVRVGDTWSRTQTLDPRIMDLPLVIKRKYTYKGTTHVQDGPKRIDVIDFKMAEVGASAEPIETSSRKSSKGSEQILSSVGRILFDREVGHIESITETGKIRGAFTETRNEIEYLLYFESNFRYYWSSKILMREKKGP